jgi:hypothetical protein
MFLNRGAEDEKNNPVHPHPPVNPGSDNAEQNSRMYTLPAGGSATQEEPNKYFPPVLKRLSSFYTLWSSKTYLLLPCIRQNAIAFDR